MQGKERRKIILLFGLFLLDRFLKYIHQKSGNFWINRGVSFGFEFRGQDCLIAFLLSVLIIFFFLKPRLGVGFILVGALSNLLDRLFYGGVVDFISLPTVSLLNNLSDILIFFGFFLLLVDLFWPRKVL